MRLLVKYPDGSLQAAILMAILGNRLRVFTSGCDDTVEFRWADGRWQAENGEPAEIQFGAPESEFHWSAESVLGGTADFPQTPAFGAWFAREAPAASSVLN